MQQNIEILQKTFQPAAVATDETKALFPIKKGERVLWASAQKLTLAAAATDTTITLGDGDDPDGFIAAIDTEDGAVGDLINGAGAYLATSGGKLYTADDTIDAVYDNGTTVGAVNPKVRFTVCVVREYPN